MRISDLWKRDKPDTSQDRNYTDAITQALIDQASDTVAGIISSQEIAAGVIGRAFASAEASGSAADLVDADNLFEIARELVLNGASVWTIRNQQLVRGINYELRDGRVVSVDKRNVTPNAVVLARYIIDANTGRGLSPLASAKPLQDLLRSMETALAGEAAGPYGYLLPVPSTAGLETLGEDIAALKGRLALVETAQAGYGAGSNQGTRQDYQVQRIGADVPDGVLSLHNTFSRYVFGLYGVPLSLVEKTDGTGQREAWRMFLHGTLTPLAAKIEAAFRPAGLTLSLSFEKLFAADIAGRARAFQSLVGSGMEIEEAAAVTGILADDA